MKHHLAALAQFGDLRITVMAGIMVMDEMAEMNRRIQALEAEVGELRQGSHGILAAAAQQEDAVTDALGELAERLNAISRKLNGRPAPATAEN